MKIDDFEHSGGKTGSRFVTRVQDVSGDEEFELTIAGPRELVRRVLADDATIELTIDSSQSEDRVKAMIDERREEQRQAMWSLAGLEDLDALFKPAPASPQRETSVVAAIRPVSGEGTPFALSISGFTVPAGASAFFFGSFVAYATGALVPATGDQDLFLHLFSTTGPVVSSSRASFTAPDVVWFTFPFPFVPVFQVFGFTTGVCANFSAFGT